jgi:hypothetical protein
MGLGTKIVILMFSITIMLNIAGMSGATEGNSYFNNILNYTYSNDTGVGNISNSITGFGLLTTNSSEATASIPFYGIFNTYGLVAQSVTMLVNIFYAPVAVLNASGAPSFITLMIAGIWTMLYILAIMSFVRGWEF